MKKLPPEPVNQWVKINKLLVTYKYALTVLATICMIFSMIILSLINRDTLVVGLTEGKSLLFVGERKAPEIREEDIVAFTKQFIYARYNWSSYDIEKLTKEIAPLVSDGFLDKVKKALRKNKKLIQDQKIAQRTIVSAVTLKDNVILAQVDRVVSLKERMKVVSPFELSIGIIRGKPNRWNPLGLYVNTVTEHESK